MCRFFRDDDCLVTHGWLHEMNELNECAVVRGGSLSTRARVESNARRLERARGSFAHASSLPSTRCRSSDVVDAFAVSRDEEVGERIEGSIERSNDERGRDDGEVDRNRERKEEREIRCRRRRARGCDFSNG